MAVSSIKETLLKSKQFIDNIVKESSDNKQLKIQKQSRSFKAQIENLIKDWTKLLDVKYEEFILKIKNK